MKKEKAINITRGEREMVLSAIE